MAKKTKPAEAKPAAAKPTPAAARPAKAKSTKAVTKHAKSAKAASKPAAAKSAASAPRAARRKPDSGPATLPFESPAPKVESSLVDRYASLEDAKSAAVDAILESIEAAEARLVRVKRATSFAELEPLANGHL